MSTRTSPSLPQPPHTLPVPPGRTGVLLVNLGTPEAPTPAALRPYLRQFLSDPRVIEVPRLLWWVILNLFILPFRPAKSAHAYARIWDASQNASPLKVITQAQATALQTRLGGNTVVRYAMRYGNPSISSELSRLKAEGCTRILIFPLYPQYSAATTATVVDDLARWLLAQRFQPAVRVAAPYYNHPAYLLAVAHSVQAHQQALGWQPQVILTSFHGMPLAYCQKGDPYYCHSHATARLLAEALGAPFIKDTNDISTLNTKSKASLQPPVLLAFQSRFGRAEWLQPYTAETLEALPTQGIKKVLVACPGFAADCVETLEEIAIAGKESFLAAGGTHFSYVPALNATPLGLDMLEGLIQTELMGWPLT